MKIVILKGNVFKLSNLNPDMVIGFQTTEDAQSRGFIQRKNWSDINSFVLAAACRINVRNFFSVEGISWDSVLDILQNYHEVVVFENEWQLLAWLSEGGKS